MQTNVYGTTRSKTKWWLPVGLVLAFSMAFLPSSSKADDPTSNWPPTTSNCSTETQYLYTYDENNNINADVNPIAIQLTTCQEADITVSSTDTSDPNGLLDYRILGCAVNKSAWVQASVGNNGAGYLRYAFYLNGHYSTQPVWWNCTRAPCMIYSYGTPYSNVAYQSVTHNSLTANTGRITVAQCNP